MSQFKRLLRILWFLTIPVLLFIVCLMIFLKKEDYEWVSVSELRKLYSTNHKNSFSDVISFRPLNKDPNLDEIVKKHNFLAITYASSTNDKFCKTLYSSISNKVPLMVVGLGESSDKLNKLAAFGQISNQLLATYPDLTLLFLDGFDVLFQQGPIEILKKYKEINKSLVYSAEKNCWPGGNKTYCDEYPRNIKVEEMYNSTQIPNEIPEVNWSVRFLNSGLMIGSALESAKFFKDAVEYIQKGYSDDQEIASLIFTSKKLNMTIDYHSSLFQSMWNSNRDLERNPKTGHFENIRTRTYPSLLHFNGDKSGFEPTESKLWYNQNQFKDQYETFETSQTPELNLNLNGFFIPNGTFIQFKENC